MPIQSQNFALRNPLNKTDKTEIDHEFFPLQEERDLHTADEAGFIYCTLMNHGIKYDPRRVDHRVFITTIFKHVARRVAKVSQES